jgi:hypothetical protein
MVKAFVSPSASNVTPRKKPLYTLERWLQEPQSKLKGQGRVSAMISPAYSSVDELKIAAHMLATRIAPEV